MTIKSLIQECNIDLFELRMLFPDGELTVETKQNLWKYYEQRFTFILPPEVLQYSSLNYHLECPLNESQELEFACGYRSTIVRDVEYSINFRLPSGENDVFGINGIHAGIQSIYPVVLGFHKSNIDTLNLKVVIRCMV